MTSPQQSVPDEEKPLLDNFPRGDIKTRYEYLIRLAVFLKPTAMIEIGVWRGDRAEQFITQIPSLKRYAGFDLFETRVENHQKESLGQCSEMMRDEVLHRLINLNNAQNVNIELKMGETSRTLPEFCKHHQNDFSFIFIDGGHSLETIENDWKYSQQLLAPGGTVVFDDYLLNDDSRGAKKCIDQLLHDKRFRVRFFPMVENIIEDLQITMVSVTKL